MLSAPLLNFKLKWFIFQNWAPYSTLINFLLWLLRMMKIKPFVLITYLLLIKMFPFEQRIAMLYNCTVAMEITKMASVFVYLNVLKEHAYSQVNTSILALKHYFPRGGMVTSNKRYRGWKCPIRKSKADNALLIPMCKYNHLGRERALCTFSRGTRIITFSSIKKNGFI